MSTLRWRRDGSGHRRLGCRLGGATAHALSAAPQTSVSAATQAYSGRSPIPGAPFLNYATSQAMASAGNGELAQTRLSSHVSVDSNNGEASIDAKAAGTGTTSAQVTAQFYGISTSRADLVFGSVSALASCGSAAAAQVKADSGEGGPYTSELQTASVSDTPGQFHTLNGRPCLPGIPLFRTAGSNAGLLYPDTASWC